MRVKTTFAEYRHDAKWAFMPAEFGRWIRTHPCALWLACECGATAGKPCQSEDGRFLTAVHRSRAQEYKRLKSLEGVNVDLEGNVSAGGRNRQLRVAK